MGSAPAIFSTRRLVLRPMHEGDVAFTAAVLGALAVSRRLARVPHPYTEADARAWLTQVERLRQEAVLDHFMIDLADGQAVGAIGLHAEGPDATDAEVGYWIAPAHWNKGYAREALGAVVRHAFEVRTPRLAVMHARAQRANPASIRVLLACGFTEEHDTVCHSAATGIDEPALHFTLRRA
ncbi:MAG: GNAT family N-acetyltransferase [Phycisphaerales bacterium]